MVRTSLIVIMLLLSINIFIAISPRSASGQEDQDKNLAFVKDLNPSSYSKVVEDESLIREIASAVREVGNTIMSNSSLCSIIDDIDRCDSVSFCPLPVILVTITLKMQLLKLMRLKIDLQTFNSILLLKPWMVLLKQILMLQRVCMSF